MTFYPNPITNGVLNVVAGATKLQTVALFDLNGKKIISLNVKFHNVVDVG
ncbi:MAG: T9SS C-terminal target domain-containing protein [Cytophagia bacterium]|nr:MAG: T9SS C-terminal target domain-containing protein [Cytophagia bacterium]